MSRRRFSSAEFREHLRCLSLEYSVLSRIVIAGSSLESWWSLVPVVVEVWVWCCSAILSSAADLDVSLVEYAYLVFIAC